MDPKAGTQVQRGTEVDADRRLDRRDSARRLGLAAMVIVMSHGSDRRPIIAGVVAPHRGPRRPGLRQPRRDAHDHRRGRHRGGAGDPRRRTACPASPRRCGSPRRTSWSRPQNHAKRTHDPGRRGADRAGHVHPDRRAVRGRDARADAGIGADGQAGRRDAAARRCVQAAHARRTRSRASASTGLRILAEVRDEIGLPVVTEVHRRRATSTWSPSTPTCCRSAPATCRTSACCRRSAASASRSCSSAG